jgi:hypothetical protein
LGSEGIFVGEPGCKVDMQKGAKEYLEENDQLNFTKHHIFAISSTINLPQKSKHIKRIQAIK